MAYYRETARGQIRGDTTGRLKLIFHRETREILGVHIIGEGATELLHIGQAVMILKGTIDYFVETVFNYPTLAECYKAGGIQRHQQADAVLGGGLMRRSIGVLATRLSLGGNRGRRQLGDVKMYPEPGAAADRSQDGSRRTRSSHDPAATDSRTGRGRAGRSRWARDFPA